MKGSIRLLVCLLACNAITGHAAMPAAYYPADGTATDQSGNGNDATLPVFPSIPAYATGKVGQAFNLDGTNRYIDFGSWFTFESFTIGMWINDGGTQTTGAPIISLFSSDAPNSTAFSLAATSTANHYLYSANDGASSIAFTLTPGTWQYLAITRDATSHVTTIYLNGTPAGTATGTGDLFLNAALIAGLRAGGDFNLTTNWKGLLDELRFYDKPLSASEVAGLSADYNAVRDFVSNTNTSSQTWQYGYSDTAGVGFTNYEANAAVPQYAYWNRTGGASEMSVIYNRTGSTYSYNQSIHQPDDELNVAPGDDGRKSIVRWLAPAVGTYQVTGLFEGIDGTGTTSDATIIKNGDTANPLLFGTGVPTPYPIPPMQNPAVNFVNGYGTQVPFSFSITLVAGDTLDFRVGWGSNNSFSYDSTGFKATITASTGGGGGNALPAITTVSKTGPSTPGGNIHFTCATQAGVSVRLQSSTTPGTEGSWTDIPGGTATESPAGTYTLDTTAYPLTSGVYFRFVSSQINYTDGKSANTLLGPYDLTNTITFSASGPVSAGAFIHFTATTAPGWSVRVQSTIKASPLEADWADLNDGNGGHMTESSITPGSYALDTTVYPAGATVSFRAIASKTSYTDVVAVPLGPLVLRQAVLGISAGLVSTSDWARGATAYVGDYLIYKLTFQNTGDAPAKSLRVIATVPTFLHADIPLVVKTVSGSKTITLASGDTSQLAIGGNFNGSNTLIPGTATITAITDATHFVISQAATGTTTGATTAATIAVFGSAALQFPAVDLSLSQGGTYVPESSPGAGDAKMQWDVGDLPGAAGFTYSQYVTFSVHLTGKVRTEQDVGIGNDYTVFSTTAPRQPAFAVTGATSNAPNVSCRVNGGISFLLNPLATTVAPGGYITYVFTLTNRSTTTAAKPVAVVEVPDNTRFATSYANGLLGVTLIAPGTLMSKLVYHTGNPLPQVVLSFPPLAANTAVQVKVTFQAKWADPAEVSKISTINYGAAFLDATQPKPISAAAQFTTLFNSASISPTAPSSTDFFALISDPTNKIARSLNQSGVINVSLSGSLDAQPLLDVFKQLSNSLAKSEDAGDGIRIDLVRPGEKLTFMIAITNNGASPADEVYVEEAMPDHCTYVASSGALFGATTSSKTKSTLTVTPDPDGHHLRFTGLHLEPQDSVSFVYTALVDGTLTVPAPTDPSLLLQVGAFSVGSGSTTTTPVGFATAQVIKVIGNVVLAQPTVQLLIPDPQVTSNLTATAATLNTLYAKTPSARPLADQKNLTSYIPGVERYYVHYQNIGNAATSGVQMTFPMPANTAFYRASWVTMTANASPGGYPGMPGTLINPPAGGSIVKPASLATGGNVTFKLTSLAAGGKGDVMIEAIVLASAVQAGSAHIGSSSDAIVISDSLAPSSSLAFRNVMSDSPLSSPLLSNHQATLALPPASVSDSVQVPGVALMRRVSTSNVQPGEQFTVTLVVMNTGSIDAAATARITVPQNAILISADYGSTFSNTTHYPGDIIQSLITSYNRDPNTNSALDPHTAGGVTFTLQATAQAGSDIMILDNEARFDSHDPISLDPITVHIVAPASLPNVSRDDLTNVQGVSWNTLKNGIKIIDIGGGNVIAQGAGNIIAQGAGNVIAQGAGNIVAAGAGNLLAVEHPLTGLLTAPSSLLAGNGLAILTEKIGNHIVQNGSEIVAAGAGNIVATGAGNIVATGAGNVVAQGAGNLVSTNGGNIVAQGAGNIVATGAGNIVAAGAGNVVAQGAGNIVSAGAGNIVAQGAGN